MVSLAAIIDKGVILAWRRLSGVNYFDRWRLFAIFCNSITVECVIIQQFSSGGEFGGTFLCDSPCRPLDDCGLYTLFQWPFSWQIKTISLQKSRQCRVVNSDMILTCTAIKYFYPSVWIWVMVSLAAIIGKGVILAWFSGVNYFDKINILCNILQRCYFRVWNYSAVFIFRWIWGHFSPWQSLPVIEDCGLYTLL